MINNSKQNQMDCIHSEVYLNLINKRNRRNQIIKRRKIVIFSIITSFVLVFTGLFGSIFSKAQDNNISSYFKYYTQKTIAYGDTLWDLADSYMCNQYSTKEAYIEEVLQINHLSKDDAILSGQTIIFPYYSSDFQ